MKGSALLDTMTRRVTEQCDQIRQEAQAEADSINAEAKERAQQTRDATLKSTYAEMEALDRRWEQKAETEAAKAELAMENDAVEEVLAKVRERIRQIVEDPSFPDVLDQLLSEVMSVAEGEIVVLAPEGQVDHVKWWLGENGHEDIEVQGAPGMWDGVAVQDRAKTFRISNTLTGRYQRVLDEARKVCMTTLFDAGGGGES